MKRNYLFVLVIICVIICTAASNVNGEEKVKDETANDLLQLYNNETLKGMKELKDKYDHTLEEYNTVYKNVKEGEAFNEFYHTAESYQKEMMAEIELKIGIVLKNNIELSKQITDYFYGDFTILSTLDATYKVNKQEATDLLTEKNKYALASKHEVDYSKLDSLEMEVKSLKEEYDSSVDVSVLGEVTNIKFPLGEESRISSPYGERLDPMNPTTIRFHAGVDLKATMNTEVLSLFNGIIADTGFGPLGGNYVKVDHGIGILSYYCHLNKVLCKVGQKVNQYDVIALSGNTGSRTTGPHLHLGLYINGNSVNPGVLFAGRDS